MDDVLDDLYGWGIHWNCDCSMKRAQLEDAAKSKLRKGMAKVAQYEQVTGKPRMDAYGKPLTYAHEMAGRHNQRVVDRFAHGWGAGAITGKPTLVWCKPCKNLGLDPWRDPEHEHDESFAMTQLQEAWGVTDARQTQTLPRL